MVNYLVATGKHGGLILKFGETKVEIKRKVKDLNQDQQDKENCHVNPVDPGAPGKAWSIL